MLTEEAQPGKRRKKKKKQQKMTKEANCARKKTWVLETQMYMLTLGWKKQQQQQNEKRETVKNK